ncbi:MAG: DUF6600 domain-containing protein, partial [Bacteroidota bacterium]
RIQTAGWKMKKLMMAIALLISAAGLAAANHTNTPQVGVRISASFGDAGYFYGSLSPYGEWIELDAGFHVWRPASVRGGWRPYLHGRWAWTDYGWYWVSSEPFGWAVFHYGRWYDDDYYGWVWVPDRVWGPSWVEWRYNNDYLGWAPLPPYASFSYGIGIRFTTRWVAPHHYWNFVRYRHFSSHSIAREVMPVEHTRRLIGTTRSTGRYEVNGDRVINRGVDRNLVERRSNTKVERVEVTDSRNRGERIVRDSGRERIEVFRPGRTDFDRTPERIDARRAERGTSLDLERIERPRREGEKTRGRDDVGQESRSDDGRGRLDNRQEEQRKADERSREQINRMPPTDQRRDGFPPRIFERRESNSREKKQPEVKRPNPAERREVSKERPRESRREVTPPPQRQRAEPQRSPQKRESPRGSEQRGGRERRKDG